MPRYFLEVAYKGTHYAGFQVQQNANTIQSEVEKALQIFLRYAVNVTGASRTDAGVHALQNYFHFDNTVSLEEKYPGIAVGGNLQPIVYRLNSILPADIAIKNLARVNDNAHCRFDAIEREYSYYIYRNKDPFLKDSAYFFPYKLQVDLLNAAADIVKTHQNFTSFSKRSTQVKSFICNITKSYWVHEKNLLVYTVAGDRFLRGMVRGLVGTMLKVGRELISEEDFKKIFLSEDCTRADFSVPACGLFLNHIHYREGFFKLAK